MPTQCVPEFRCGTVYSGWLKGGHPTLADGKVSSQVCFTRGGDCCKNIISIPIKGPHLVSFKHNFEHCTLLIAKRLELLMFTQVVNGN